MMQGYRMPADLTARLRQAEAEMRAEWVRCGCRECRELLDQANICGCEWCEET